MNVLTTELDTQNGEGGTFSAYVSFTTIKKHNLKRIRNSANHYVLHVNPVKQKKGLGMCAHRRPGQWERLPGAWTWGQRTEVGSGGVAATPRVPCSLGRFQEDGEKNAIAFRFIIKLKPALGEVRTSDVNSF